VTNSPTDLDLATRLHNYGTAEWIRRDQPDEKLRVAQACVDALDAIQKRDAETERLRDLLRSWSVYNVGSRELMEQTKAYLASIPMREARSSNEQGNERWLRETWEMIEANAKETDQGHRISLSPLGCAALIEERRHTHETSARHPDCAAGCFLKNADRITRENAELLAQMARDSQSKTTDEPAVTKRRIT